MLAAPRLPALFAAALVCLTAPAASGTIVDLTHGGQGYWQIFGDCPNCPGPLEEARLVFTTQFADGDVQALVGYLQWDDPDQTIDIKGKFDPVGMTICLQGQWLADPWTLIERYRLSGTVNTDGTIICDGTSVPCGSWSAEYVPEPGTAALLAVAALGLIRRRRPL